MPKPAPTEGGLPTNPKDMTDTQAKQVLLDNFDNAEIRAYGGNRDGHIGQADLQKLANDKTTDPHLREAAQRMLNSPDMQQTADVNGGANVGLTKASLKEAITEDKQVGNAAGTLLENFDNAEIRAFGGNRDGFLGMADLKKLASDPSTDPVLRDAANTMIDQAKRDGVNGYRADDLQKMVDSSATEKPQVRPMPAPVTTQPVEKPEPGLPANPKDMTDAQAKQVLRDNFDSLDKSNGGVISHRELKKAAKNADDPHVREAAQRMLKDSDTQQTADVRGGRRVALTKDSLDKAISEDKSVSNASETLRADFNRASGGDGHLSRADLKDLANNEYAPADVRDAAKEMLAQAKRDGVDGYSAKDLDKISDGNVPEDKKPKFSGLLGGGLLERIQNIAERKEKESDAASVLLDNFAHADVRAHGGDANGHVGLSDLRKLASDPTTDPKLADAAETLLKVADRKDVNGFRQDDLKALMS
jgi:hypothetical protein